MDTVTGHLAKSAKLLDDARKSIAADLIEAAGHQAKTHDGINTLFAEIARDQGEAFLPYRGILPQLYALTQTADYLAVDAPALPSHAEAAEAIERAALFHEFIVGCISRRR